MRIRLRYRYVLTMSQCSVRKESFTIGLGVCQDTLMSTKLLDWESVRTHSCQPDSDVVRMWRQFHGLPPSGGGIERVFFTSGKQHDALK
jgi:hypothetical protein